MAQKCYVILTKNNVMSSLYICSKMWTHADHKITFGCGLEPVKASLSARSFDDVEISKVLPLRGSLGGLRQASPTPPAFYQHGACHKHAGFKKIEHTQTKNLINYSWMSLIIHEVRSDFFEKWLFKITFRHADRSFLIRNLSKNSKK